MNYFKSSLLIILRNFIGIFGAIIIFKAFLRLITARKFYKKFYEKYIKNRTRQKKE